MSDYSARLTKNGAYRISKEMIRSLIKIVEPFIDEDPSITFHLQEDHEIKDDNLDALLDDPYIGAKYIKKMSIDGSDRRADVWRHIDITFEVDLMQTVSVSIRGERKESTALRSEIENILKGAELWYSFLYLPYGYVFAFVSALTPFLLIGVATLASAALLGYGQNGQYPVWILAVIAALLGLFYGAKSILFPKLIFEFGKSATRGRYAAYWLNFIFGTIIIGFLGKLVLDHFLKL